MFGFVKSHKMMVACGVLALAAIGGLAGGKTEETASVSTTTTVATTTSTIPETTTTITPTTMASPEERFFEVVASAGYVVSIQNQGSDAADSDINESGASPAVTLESGEIYATLDAGLHQLATLGDLVWEDSDADGVHLTAKQLRNISQRPHFDLVGASCDNTEELRKAEQLGVDFAVLGPVLPTPTHPDAVLLGWAGVTPPSPRAAQRRSRRNRPPGCADSDSPGPRAAAGWA